MKEKHPKQLFLLAAAQMWKSFSHYGMRSLLILYMISELKFSDRSAYGVYAVYGGLVELGGILGGIAADRFLGVRRTIVLGGCLIGLGHLCMALETAFYLGLGLIVVGSNFFTTNIFTLLGFYYKKNDPRREEGFTLFYMFLNLGALLATVLCGIVAASYGWHWGFGLAAFGMMIANLILISCRKLLAGKGEPARPVTPRRWILLLLFTGGGLLLGTAAITQESLMLPLLPWIGGISVLGVSYQMIRSRKIPLEKIVSLLLHLAALIFFFAVEEQMASSLIVFSERMVEKTVWGVAIPVSSILSINPAVILTCGIFISRLFGRFQPAAVPYRLVFPFILSGIAFGGLSIGCFLNPETFPLFGVVLAMGMISLSELMIGPAVYSYFSEIAGQYTQGIVMGLIPIGFALASILGGALSKTMAIETEAASLLFTYGKGFGLISGICLSASALLFLVKSSFRSPFLRKREQI